MDHVVQGRNKRLFLGRQIPFDIDLFTSGAPFQADELWRWECCLRRRAAELARRSIPYVFYVVPDAHSVYPEDLPDGVRHDFRTPGQIFLDAMKDVPGVVFVYPLAELRTAKGDLDPYKINDTHWSHYGSLVGYRSFCAALPPRLDFTEVSTADVDFTMRRMYGDLGSMVEPEQVAWAPVASIRNHHSQVVFENNGVSRLNVVETTSNTAAGGRAMFFRDSFMTDQAQYIACSFSNTLLAGTTTRLHLEEVDRWRPDIVVSQVCERRLFAYESDHGSEMFDDIYRTDYQSPLGRKLLMAMLQLEAGDARTAWLSLTALGSGSDRLQMPGHCFAAARIAFAQGETAAEEGFLAAALSEPPESAS